MSERDEAVERAAELAAIGLAGRGSGADTETLLSALHDDPDARVRVAALGALVRAARRSVARAAWLDAVLDRDPAVRRRAVEVAPALGRHVPVRALVTLSRDADPSVAEGAAFALGERGAGSKGALDALVEATAHDDPLVREAAVAALGALGDDRALDAILRACDDRPPIRRRAVLALAAFEGPAVEAALQRALEDHDWQVRQAAEDLLSS